VSVLSNEPETLVMAKVVEVALVKSEDPVSVVEAKDAETVPLMAPALLTVRKVEVAVPAVVEPIAKRVDAACEP
jgi:hypothetical protein